MAFSEYDLKNWEDVRAAAKRNLEGDSRAFSSRTIARWQREYDRACMAVAEIAESLRQQKTGKWWEQEEA